MNERGERSIVSMKVNIRIAFVFIASYQAFGFETIDREHSRFMWTHPVIQSAPSSKQTTATYRPESQ